MSGWLLWTLCAGASAQQVTLPLAVFEQMQPVEPAAVPPAAPAAFGARVLTGRTVKGVLEARLDASVRAFVDGAVVPILPASATPVSVRGAGGPLRLERVGDTWAVRLPRGDHQVTVDFLHGREDDRFERALVLALPAGGTTWVSIALPETDIDATLSGGALEAVRTVGDQTVVEGRLDATGAVELTWRQRQHVSDARASVVAAGLITLSEQVLEGKARLDVSVVEGELSAIELDLPAPLELLDATGDDVLQWYATEDGARVLLRRAVSNQVSVELSYQIPVEPDAPVRLQMPLPRGMKRKGHIAVEARPGFEAVVADLGNGEELAAHAVPESISELSRRPVLMAFGFEGQSEVAIDVRVHPTLDPVTTAIDDVQAITVALEDGTRVGKARLLVRNTARQYLAVSLPASARMTHCYLDGTPVRPAMDGDRVLVPLLASETGKIPSHQVAFGDTLSGIAQRWYGDAAYWRRVATANGFGGSDQLQPGAVLKIPPLDPAAGQMRSFTLEFAWRQEGAALDGLGGIVEVALPKFDVDAAGLNWHVYLPDSFERVGSGGNVVAASHGRGALLDLAGTALASLVPVADAGGYRNVLEARKEIWKQERRSDGQVAAAFPLVGEKHRFRRSLLGQDRAVARVAYVSGGVAGGIDPALAALGALAGGLLGFRRWLLGGLAAVAAVGAGLVVGPAVWLGAILALLAVLAWRDWAWVQRGLSDLALHPWRLLSWGGLFGLAGLWAVVVAGWWAPHVMGCLVVCALAGWTGRSR
jgi:LysM repeat protein